MGLTARLMLEGIDQIGEVLPGREAPARGDRCQGRIDVRESEIGAIGTK